MLDKVSELLSRLRRTSMSALQRFTLGKQDKLTVSEVFSLYFIDLMNGPTLKSFAETMGISQSNATYKINALAEKGFVEKRPCLEDRREMNLYLTRKAKKLIQDGDISQEELEAALRSRFTEEQLITAEAVFQAVVELMETKER